MFAVSSAFRHRSLLLSSQRTIARAQSTFLSIQCYDRRSTRVGQARSQSSLAEQGSSSHEQSGEENNGPWRLAKVEQFAKSMNLDPHAPVALNLWRIAMQNSVEWIPRTPPVVTSADLDEAQAVWAKGAEVFALSCALSREEREKLPPLLADSFIRLFTRFATLPARDELLANALDAAKAGGHLSQTVLDLAAARTHDEAHSLALQLSADPDAVSDEEVTMCAKQLFSHSFLDDTSSPTVLPPRLAYDFISKFPTPEIRETALGFYMADVKRIWQLAVGPIPLSLASDPISARATMGNAIGTFVDDFRSSFAEFEQSLELRKDLHDMLMVAGRKKDADEMNKLLLPAMRERFMQMKAEASARRRATAAKRRGARSTQMGDEQSDEASSS